MKGFMLRVFVGAAAGLLGWALMEPSVPPLLDMHAWESWEQLFITILGILIGAGVGGVNGYLTGGKIHTLRGLALGAILGAIGISIGAGLGSVLRVALFGTSITGLNILTTILARIVGLTPIGALLGLAIGVSTLSLKRAKYGLFGGALAGFAGGAVFDVIGLAISPFLLAAKGVSLEQPTVEIGGPSRAIYAVILGAGIALFISIVETLAKSAWLKLELGRNEGREWPIFSERSMIGRSETATIPIFGDPSLQPYHALITHQADGYCITDNGGGMMVNGQPAAQAMLFSGTTIRLGNTQLKFLMKEGHAPARGPETYGTPSYPIQGYPYQPQAPISPQAAPASAPQPTAFTVVAMDGPLIGQRYSVTFPIEVGRTCPTIPMDFDTMASRRHASLALAPGGVLVTDLGSTNGTFVDGLRVHQAVAGPGQLIKIGSTTFRVE